MDGRKKISLAGILNSKAKAKDKVWLVTKLMDSFKAAEFAEWCADSVADLNNTYSRWAAAAAARAAAADAAADVAAAAAGYAARATGCAEADVADVADAWATERKKQVNKLRELI